MSVDPLQKKFSWLTPYQYAGNSPIRFIDLDGLEPLEYSYNWKRSTEGTSKWNYNVANVYDNWTKQTWTVMQYPNDNKIYYWKPYDGTHQTFNETTAKTNALGMVSGSGLKRRKYCKRGMATNWPQVFLHFLLAV